MVKILNPDNSYLGKAAHLRSPCSILIGNNGSIDTTDKEPGDIFDTVLRVLEVSK